MDAKIESRETDHDGEEGAKGSNDNSSGSMFYFAYGEKRKVAPKCDGDRRMPTWKREAGLDYQTKQGGWPWALYDCFYKDGHDGRPNRRVRQLYCFVFPSVTNK